MQEDSMDAPIAALVAETSVMEDLERRVAELEAAVASLREVSASAALPGRKTHRAVLLAKGAEEGPHSVDGALGSLSVEQRIAVKAGLVRAGLI